MIHTAQTVFDQRPESLNAIRVLVANDINLLRVMNAPMIVTKRIEATIRRMLVRVHDRAWQHSFLNERLKGVGVHVRNNSGDHVALTLNGSGNDGLVFASATSLPTAASVTANVSLVNLYATAQRFVIFSQHLTNLLEHAPRGFVGNARLALNLFGGDTATRRSHQIDRMEPRFQRRAGLVVNRISGRVNMMTAILARIRFARDYFVMLRDLAARIAKDAVWIQVILEPFKASVIIRELSLKILERIARHLRAGDFRLCHAQNYTGSRTYSQGIIT